MNYDELVLEGSPSRTALRLFCHRLVAHQFVKTILFYI